jgi:hypothetical protein
MPIHMGDNFSRQEINIVPKKKLSAIQRAYPNSECPDCGEPIPEDIQEGQECCQCGHVFCLERKDD